MAVRQATVRGLQRLALYGCLGAMGLTGLGCTTPPASVQPGTATDGADSAEGAADLGSAGQLDVADTGTTASLCPGGADCPCASNTE